MKTELLYMKNMGQFKCSAKVVSYRRDGERVFVVLDKTIFYPQGGGQPYDTGLIKSMDDGFVFTVQEVKFADGLVEHIGVIDKGQLFVGMDVSCFVDSDRRSLNSRLHSAGHLIDMVIKELVVDWVSGKGYHYPQGAYVEYSGKIDNLNLDDLKSKIEQKCNEIISRDIEVKILINSDSINKGKFIRFVLFDKYSVPCGGTHVLNLREIVSVKIRKIKKEKNLVRVSYFV
jgi:Ser-tRNA(Ala) deacylase AlaX